MEAPPPVGVISLGAKPQLGDKRVGERKKQQEGDDHS
eukprot:CAMPEP_0182550884 /NCGR_PEP_ID=MMETSP1323-20130603/42918_1 /TAXON_ID=236787 /ORGANISM="Florenciella parvula, Strain RCC1693" /LENGTH=36 /DNA_ID= /DNA_START= /DNA_END= /DNA_ORIENTATION=